mgnify:FL=1
MEISNKERVIFDDIQKKLFYMIPEKWDAIYLYASIVEEPLKKPVGEMYFYYLPKGILKRKPVNVYQIPGMFNIDEESYNELIQRLFLNIKQLRMIHKENNPRVWTNITISIENYQFKIEYAYEDLGRNSEFTPYERHIIWRYKHLNDDFDFQTKEEKNIINQYLNSNLIRTEKNNDIYTEGMYKQHVHNIIDYERMMTIEAAIASQKEEISEDVKKSKSEKKRNKKDEENIQNNKTLENENQILFNRVDQMKKSITKHEEQVQENNIEDDMILSSDFMTKKDKNEK